MKWFITKWFMLPLWASPGSSIYDLILGSDDWTVSRRARALEPGFPRDDPVEEPPVLPVRPTPTDVPVPDPHDVPARDPMDVPPPDPGVVPKPDTKPRPTP